MDQKDNKETSGKPVERSGVLVSKFKVWAREQRCHKIYQLDMSRTFAMSCNMNAHNTEHVP